MLRRPHTAKGFVGRRTARDIVEGPMKAKQNNGRESFVAARLRKEVEDFIAQHDFDERVSEDLRQLDAEVQHLVLEEGSLGNARNPSACLKQRIRTAEAHVGRRGARENAGRREGKDGKRMDEGAVGRRAEGRGKRGEEEEDEQLRDVIEDFIEENDVDDHAGDELRGADPEVQRLVLDVGSLSKARNPSVCLIKRIKNAKASIGDICPRSARDRGNASISSRGAYDKAEPRQGVIRLRDEIENFIKQNGIDDHAGADLRQADQEIQRLVLEEGSLGKARNPSLSLINRIKRISRFSTPAANAGRSSSMDSRGEHIAATGDSVAKHVVASDVVKSKRISAGLQEEIDDFIEENEIGRNAADILREADPDVQRLVLDQGSLKKARNPSAILVRRIRAETNARSGLKGSKEVHVATKANLSATSMGASSVGKRKRVSAGLSEEVDDFIEENDIGRHAADELRGADPKVQRSVLNEGTLTRARNPSAVLMRRIQTAEGNLARSSFPKFRDSQTRLDKFRSGNSQRNGWLGRRSLLTRKFHSRSDLAEVRSSSRRNSGEVRSRSRRNSRDVRSSSRRNRGEVVRSNQRNSGEVCGNSGEVCDSTKDDWKATRQREEVEDFIDQNDIDKQVANELRQAEPEVQRLVLDDGKIRNAKNPSGVLMRRIQTAKVDLVKDKCDGGEVHVNRKEIEDFLAQNNIDPKASDALRDCSPEIQLQVMIRGKFQDCKNPSSAMMSRIKQVRESLLRRTQHHKRQDRYFKFKARQRSRRRSPRGRTEAAEAAGMKQLEDAPSPSGRAPFLGRNRRGDSRSSSSPSRVRSRSPHELRANTPVVVASADSSKLQESATNSTQSQLADDTKQVEPTETKSDSCKRLEAAMDDPYMEKSENSQKEEEDNEEDDDKGNGDADHGFGRFAKADAPQADKEPEDSQQDANCQTPPHNDDGSENCTPDKTKETFEAKPKNKPVFRKRPS